MTKKAKTATAAALALLSSITLMFLPHSYGPHASMREAAGHGPHSMTTMWSEMGWMMALGPVAMALLLGSIVTFVVLVVGSLKKQS